MTVQTSTLTESQHKFRKRVIGGSDATIIMSGDKDRIYRLWQEKRGEAEREDLSNVLPVQIGIFTEPFNVKWFEKQTGRKVTHRNDSQMSIDHPFMAANLDGLTDDGATYFEAKHVNQFAKEDEQLAKYLPQLHHCMIVCGIERAVLSVLYGTLKWACVDVEYDPLYGLQLIEAERHFWACVESGEPPVAIQAPAPPVKAIRKVVMDGNNEWSMAAADWLENQAPAKKFAAAEKAIKGAIEADVVEASGHGVLVKRNAGGALSIKPMK